MNIKILDSWLREYLKTEAKPKDIADVLSLTSVSVERLEEVGSDFVYDIEITTNRPDLMSVIGLAREAAAILPQEGIEAKFVEPKFQQITNTEDLEIKIKFDPSLVNRVCAVACEISLGPSPEKISKRLELMDIRSINNAVDVTNYVMREVGHPMHAFDYDKLKAFGGLKIRLSKKGEQIKTLDGANYTLEGGDIVAESNNGEIIDLLGVMGTENSAVDDGTQRVLLFVDNNDATRIRKTSMSLAIRSEAAILNEKGVDPELALPAIERGVELMSEIANARVVSKVFDEYPHKPEEKQVVVEQSKINSVIGVDIDVKRSAKILADLGFDVTVTGEKLTVTVPSWRANDVEIPEDLIEEVARVYGYFKLPSVIPPSISPIVSSLADDVFYWERRVRYALKHWGYNEVYTYPMVSEEMLEESPDNSVTIKNPLTADHIYMRRTLVPSLLAAARENKRETVKIFEIANVYIKKKGDLPSEELKLAGVFMRKQANFLEVKGLISALMEELGIKKVEFKPAKSGAVGAQVIIEGHDIGEIEVLEENLIDFELDFDAIVKYANLSKTYTPISRFPESIEDLRFEIDEDIPFEKIVNKIKEQSDLIKRVELLDVYKNKKTFRVVYQSHEKNLTNEEITHLREKVSLALQKSFKAVAS